MSLVCVEGSGFWAERRSPRRLFFFWRAGDILFGYFVGQCGISNLPLVGPLRLRTMTDTDTVSLPKENSVSKEFSEAEARRIFKEKIGADKEEKKVICPL
jgi:hypothetical protein